MARNLGRETDTECPICEHEQLVHVMFAFGPGLPPGGLPLTDIGGLSKAAREECRFGLLPGRSMHRMFLESSPERFCARRP